MIPLSQYIRRGKAARDIKIKVKPEANTAIPVTAPEKKDWKQACLEYQLKNGASLPEQKISVCTIDNIKRVVTAYFKLFDGDLVSQRKDARVVLPRQISYYLAKKLTDKSMPQIGRAIGFRDHTTIMSGIKKIEVLLQTGKTLLPIIEELENNIRNGIRPTDRPPPAQYFVKRGPWSIEETSLAIQLSAKGWTLREIGMSLGRTGASVRSRFRKIGVAGHATRAAIRREKKKRATAKELELIVSNATVSAKTESRCG